MKIGSETRGILFLFLLLISASIVMSVWVFREREKARHAFQEREESLLQTITSLKEELSKAKVMGQELEGKLQDLSNGTGAPFPTASMRSKPCARQSATQRSKCSCAEDMRPAM